MEPLEAQFKPKRYRFARFQLDPMNFELRRDSNKIRLARLPLELLILLVERRGTLVNRSTIVAELWQNPGLLETDQNINTAVRQIRAALGDDAAHPLFVETVVGKGYRFISPTEEEQTTLPLAAENTAASKIDSSSGLPRVTAEQPAILETASIPADPFANLPVCNSFGRQIPVWLALGATILVVILAFWSMHHFWRAPGATLSNIRRLDPQSGLESFPVFSPDGKRLAFLRAQHPGDPNQIFVQTVEDGTKVQLTDFPGGIRCLAWNPGADRIAFLAAKQESDEVVWAVSVADKSVAPLTKLLASGEFTWLDWSPDGKFLAVGDRIADPGLFSISLVQIDSSSRRQLTYPPMNSTGDSDPRFSPDGKMVAFRRNWQAGQDDVLVTTLADGKETALTRDRRGIGGYSWSPDSKSVVVSSARVSSLPSLWLFSLDPAMRPIQLTEQGESAADPSLAKVANRVAWSESVANTNIWRVPVSGAGPPEQVTAARYANQEPSLSRDGALAFRSDRTGDDQIWVAHADGSGAHPITQFRGALAGSPRWSPDGRYLAFDSREQGNADIFIAACDSASLVCEQPRQFTHDASAEVVPGWSADSKTVYFASDRSGRLEVWRQLLFGSEAVQVTQNNGYAPSESPDGRWLIFSKLIKPIGFFRLRLGGSGGTTQNGPEENIVPKMNFPKAATWAMAGNELIYVDEFTAPPKTRFLARNLDTDKIRMVLTLDGMRLARVIDVSADDRWIYYSGIGRMQSSISIADLHRR